MATALTPWAGMGAPLITRRSEGWSDGDRSYVAISDISPSELALFADLFRKAAAGEKKEAR